MGLGPAIYHEAGAGQAAFSAGLSLLGFESVDLAEAHARLARGEPILVNGWCPGHSLASLASEHPGQIAVVWHSGWTGSDTLGEGHTLAFTLREARAGRIKLLWLESRDVPPEGSIPIAPIWDPASLIATAGQRPKRDGLAVMVGLHGHWPSAAKNILACVAAAAAASRETGAHLHVGERSLAGKRGETVAEILRGVPHTAHPPLECAEVARLLASCDVLVHASLTEAWPYLAMESVYAGTPVVISDAIPWAERLSPWAQSVCVARPAKHSKRIAELLTALLRDPDTCARLVAEQRAVLDAAADECRASACRTLLELGFDVVEPRDLSDQITAFLITTGEPSTQDTLRALEAQSARVRIETIANVTPMHCAFQAMLDRCETPLFVQVDADMTLRPHAIQALWNGIRADERCAEYVGWLWGDAEERPIQGVKIYRHEAARAVPYADGLSCEVPALERLRALGWAVVAAPIPSSRAECLGEHRSLQTPAMAFARWRRLVQKHRALPWMGWLGPYPRRMLERFKADPSETNLAVLAGVIAGLTGPIPTTEADASVVDQGYRRFAGALGEYSHGPRELVLYTTERCNFSCAWCARTLGHTPHAGDITPEQVDDALERFPSVQGVCVAGFGEPLLHPRLGEILDVLGGWDVNVGLITNGSLLESRIDLLRSRPRLAYVSVSLNAATAAEHRAINGSETWQAVLAGIRAGLAAGLRVGVSCVCTRQNVGRIPALLALAEGLGVRFVHLLNVLPHGSPDFEQAVLRVSDEAFLKPARSAPGAELVEVWPELLSGESPRRCMSPFVSLGIDARGAVSACRRVLPPSLERGGVCWPDLWHDPAHVGALRRAQTGDAELPAECRGCFGGWRG